MLTRITLYCLFIILFCCVAGAQTPVLPANIFIELSIPKTNYDEKKDTTVVIYNSKQKMEENDAYLVYIGDKKNERPPGYVSPFEFIEKEEVQRIVYKETVEELAEMQLIDTSGKLLKNELNTFILDIDINKLYIYGRRVGLAIKPGYHIQLNYILRNSYHEKKLDIPITLNTGVAGYNVMSVKQTDAAHLMLKDTLRKTFRRLIHEVVESPAFKQEVNEEISELSKKKEPFAPIKLSPGSLNSAKASDLIKSVVTIKTKTGHGSGCIVSEDGYIITNYHVIADQNSISISNDEVHTDSVEIIRTDKVHDLALLKIKAQDLKALHLQAGDVEPGTEVLVIGTPADTDLGQTISKGVVSGIRNIGGNKSIQSDARINPGNSGGAMINKQQGKLIGIVNAKIVGNGIEGIGFAIPVEIVLTELNLTY